MNSSFNLLQGGYGLDEMAETITKYIKFRKKANVRIVLDTNNEKEVDLFIKYFDHAHLYFYGTLPIYHV